MVKEKETTKENGGEEMIEISKRQLESILTDIDNLKRGQRFEKPKRVTERIARLRFHEGKPVVWYGNVKEIWDDKIAEKVAYMDIKLQGENKPITVRYLEFLNTSNWVQVLIKEQRGHQITQTLGRKMVINPDPVFNKKFQQVDVEDEVVSYEYEADVEVLEGEQKGITFTIPTSCLNA